MYIYICYIYICVYCTCCRKLHRLEGTMFDPAAGEASSAHAVPELEAHPFATGLHQVVEL